jgi:hypothetical protein
MNAIRKEVLENIDVISKQPVIIETELTSTEKKSIAAGVAEYKTAPETFKPLREVI